MQVAVPKVILTFFYKKEPIFNDSRLKKSAEMNLFQHELVLMKMWSKIKKFYLQYFVATFANKIWRLIKDIFKKSIINICDP